MKTLSTLLQKAQDFVGGSWMKILVISMVLSAPIAPTPVNVPLLSPSTVEARESLTGSQAETEFKRLFMRMRNFAGYLLIIGVIIAGLFFITGKTTMALTVFVGAVVVYGGAYVIDMVNQSFSDS